MAPLPPPTADEPTGTTTHGFIADTTDDSLRPIPPTSFYIALQTPSVPSPAIAFFFSCLPQPEREVLTAYKHIQALLYPSSDAPLRRSPGVTLVLDDHDGLAYTAKSHVHLSLRWVETHRSRADPVASAYEFRGVILHELVHVLQFDGGGSAPWWWIEGLADFVRLRAGLGARHWKKRGEGESWEAGYDTTAVFLDWLDEEQPGAIARMNARLATGKWRDAWWEEMTGRSVKEHWKRYKRGVSAGEEETLHVGVRVSDGGEGSGDAAST